MEIVKIGAMWCPACIMMAKIWPKIEKEYDIKIRSLDLDFDSEEVKEYNVGDKLPVIIFKKENNEISRIIGEKKYDDIKNEIERLI